MTSEEFKWNHRTFLDPELTAHCQEQWISSCAARGHRGCPDQPLVQEASRREGLWIYHSVHPDLLSMNPGLWMTTLPEDKFSVLKSLKREAYRIKFSASVSVRVPNFLIWLSLTLWDVMGLLWSQKLQFFWRPPCSYVSVCWVNSLYLSRYSSSGLFLFGHPSYQSPSPNQSTPLPLSTHHTQCYDCLCIRLWASLPKGWMLTSPSLQLQHPEKYLAHNKW